MARASISWAAVILCVAWVGWFVYDVRFNSGLTVYGSRPSSGSIEIWKVDLKRIDLLILELALTVLGAIVLRWLSRGRQ
jgi:hypothetical protein